MFNKIKYKIGVVVLDTEIPYVDEWGQASIYTNAQVAFHYIESDCYLFRTILRDRLESPL